MKGCGFPALMKMKGEYIVISKEQDPDTQEYFYELTTFTERAGWSLTFKSFPELVQEIRERFGEI